MWRYRIQLWSIKDCNYLNIAQFVSPTQWTGRDCSDGSYGIIRRQIALNNLKMGTLVVEVRMKRPESPYPFIPENPSVCKTIQGLFMDEDTADIVFEAKGKAESKAKQGTAKNQHKDTVPDAKTFFAHSLILKKAAPLLAELCASDNTTSTVHIPNVSPDTFHHLLHYIYGLDIPAFGADISHTKEIIEAADRYGVSSLKLEAEAYYVSSVTITLDNVMGHLHFADSMNCALLKEAIMDFIVRNKVEILSKKILTNAPIDLINDILVAMMRVDKKDAIDFNMDFSAMRISELRRQAFNAGLDIDGSRETLVAAVESLWNPKVSEGEKEDDEDEEAVE
ncbi:hypothetical protein ACHAWU_010181 [Discostella pseudostelligera]|uniref:BTB domain-containing protein n=1 Tax=Discostella pseudostelligera TaxID=259834 RepID=A0ABD3M0L4_9STRA